MTRLFPLCEVPTPYTSRARAGDRSVDRPVAERGVSLQDRGGTMTVTTAREWRRGRWPPFLPIAAALLTAGSLAAAGSPYLAASASALPAWSYTATISSSSVAGLHAGEVIEEGAISHVP